MAGFRRSVFFLGMAEKETVVAQASAPEYGNLATSAGTTAMDADDVNPHGGSGASGKSDVTDVNSSHADISASDVNTSVDASQLAAYHSSVNGNDVTDGKPISENGVGSYDVHNTASANQPEDGSVVAALSPEEERLWSIVNANSSEFNAWTALIDETEKTAEVPCIVEAKK
ncbi:hypothetical protein HanOQP8_Chr01g0018611 [Helianthus annuus]|nr:hypothetical protein HanOQP8_Chr01g0018611 [Helianthus annuus]